MSHLCRVHITLRRALSHLTRRRYVACGCRRVSPRPSKLWKLALVAASFVSTMMIFLSPAAAQTAPSITQISPSSGAVGTSVTITGINFGSTGTVTFNGISATPTSWGSTTIVVSVPSGATTGPVTVTVNGVGSNGLFFTTGSLTSARQNHTATLLANGLVLIAGGIASGGSYLSSAELYNPATGIFSTTGSLNAPRAYHTATMLSN